MYDRYTQLISSLQDHNSLTIEESETLQKLIDGRKKHPEKKYTMHILDKLSLSLTYFFKNKFRFIKRLPSGHTIYKENSTSNQKQYIIKHYYIDRLFSHKYDKQFITNIINGICFKHPHITNLKYFGKARPDDINEKYFYLIDYIKGINLENYIFGEKSHDWNNIKDTIIYQYTNILSAMNYFHSHEVENLGIDPSKIIYDPIQKSFILEN